MKVLLKKVINKNEVLTQLQCYENSENYNTYSETFDEVLKEILDNIEVIGYYCDHKPNEYIKQSCEKSVYCMVTLGNWVDTQVNFYFESYEYLKGMMLNSLADYILFEASNQLYTIISESYKTNNLYLTTRYETGTTKIPLQFQETILNVINETHQTDLELTSGFMIKPSKSLAYFYGVSNKNCSHGIDHDCSTCDMITCPQRKLNLVIIENDHNKIVKVKQGENLLKALRDNDFLVEAPCGGKGLCGKCKVKLIDGKIDYEQSELNFLTKSEIDNGIILACFHQINQNMVIEISQGKKSSKITSDFGNIKINNPKYNIITIEGLKETVQDNESLISLINNKLNKEYKTSIYSIRDLSNLNNIKNPFNLLIKNNQKICSASENKIKAFGIAIDIGTTTIAISLINLLTRENIETYKSMNPQRIYGADVISRIQHTLENKEQVLTKIIQKEIKDAITEILSNQKLEYSDIYEMAIAGNTTMVYLLLGINPYKISISPFTTVDTSMLKLTTCELFGFNSRCEVVILPTISAYIGADIVSGMYGIDILNNKDTVLFIDIGTNGEMAIKYDDKIITASTAAGPAFEGANIKCGMGSIEGALYNVSYEKNKYKYSVIGNTTPKGICGSALIDISADLINRGIVDKTGRMEVKKVNIHGDISLFQEDIRQLQLAKAAIAAGIEVLLDAANLKFEDIDTLYLAGGFGSNLSIDNATTIGLIPSELKEKVTCFGNSSLAGCVKYLLEYEADNSFDNIKAKCDYIELSTNMTFNNAYIMEMGF